MFYNDNLIVGPPTRCRECSAIWAYSLCWQDAPMVIWNCEGIYRCRAMCKPTCWTAEQSRDWWRVYCWVVTHRTWPSLAPDDEVVASHTEHWQVPEDAEEEGKLGYTILKRIVWHNSFSKILDEVVIYSWTGYAHTLSYDKITRTLFPTLLILSGDYEEQYIYVLWANTDSEITNIIIVTYILDVWCHSYEGDWVNVPVQFALFP